MKIRNGFISNSSTSSFIVSKKDYDILSLTEDMFIIMTDHEDEEKWGKWNEEKLAVDNEVKAAKIGGDFAHAKDKLDRETAVDFAKIAADLHKS